MTVRWSEVTGALFTFLVLVVLPIAGISLLQPQILDKLSATGFEIKSLITETAILGLIITIIALTKSITAKTSVSYLVLDISSNIVSLAFGLLVVGVGNISNLGYSAFKLTQGKLTTEIVLDLRVFIWITVGVVALSVLQSVANYHEASEEPSQVQNSN